MPKVPVFEQRSGLISDSPPGVDINERAFGDTQNALGQIGGMAADFGIELLKKRKQAQDQDFAFNQSLEDAREFEKFNTELQTNMPSTYEGYASAVQKWTNDRFEQNQKSAPSETAKRLYQSQSGPMFNRNIVQATGLESVKKAEAYHDKIVKGIDFDANLMVSTPSQDFANDMINKRVEQINAAKGVTIDDKTATLLIDRTKNTVAKGLLDGLYAKGLGDAKTGKKFFQEGIDVLKGVDNYAKGQGADVQVNVLAHGLEPHEKAAYLDKFERALKEHKQTDTAELRRRYQDNLTTNLSTGKVDPTLWADIKTSVAEGSLQKEEAIRWQDSLNAAGASGEILKSMKTLGPSKWSSVMGQWDSKMNAIIESQAKTDPELKAASQISTFNAAERERWKNMLVAEGQSLIRQRNEDPTAYVIQNFPGVAEAYRRSGNDPQKTEQYITRLYAQQQQLEIPPSKIRVLSKQESASLGAALSGNNPQQVAQAYTVFEQKYGKFFPQVFSELVEDKRVDPELAIAATIKDPMQREKSIANVINSKDIDKAFNERFPDQAKSKELSEAVVEQVDGYTSALSNISSDGGSLEYANAMRTMVNREAKKIMSTSPDNPSAADAAKRAMAVISQNYNTINAANSAIVHPRQIGGVPINDRIIESYMISHKTPEALEEMNIKLPNGPYYNKLTPEQKKTEFFHAIEKNGYWVTNKHMDGMRLEIVNTSGQREPVLDNRGYPIEVKYREISQNPDKRTLQQTKPALKRFWEKITGGSSGQ